MEHYKLNETLIRDNASPHPMSKTVECCSSTIKLDTARHIGRVALYGMQVYHLKTGTLLRKDVVILNRDKRVY